MPQLPLSDEELRILNDALGMYALFAPSKIEDAIVPLWRRIAEAMNVKEPDDALGVSKRQLVITIGAAGEEDFTIGVTPKDGEYVRVRLLLSLLENLVKCLHAVDAACKNATGKSVRTRWHIKSMGMGIGPTESKLAEMWACENLMTA